jgi:hypothetical protein
MPLNKDEQGGGTNADGSNSTMYCSKCYQHGAFTRPEIDSPEKMQVLVKEKLKEMGFPGFLAGLFTKGFRSWSGGRNKSCSMGSLCPNTTNLIEEQPGIIKARTGN